MSREKIDLIGPLAIIQGETYRELIWTVPGDKTTWTPRGQIRTALLQDAGTLLAEFYFDTPVYNAETDTTAIYPYLVPGQTVTLLKTKYQGIGEITKRNVYFYDLELELDGEVYKLAPGFVQVTGEVTDEGAPPIYPVPNDWLDADDIGVRVQAYDANLITDSPSDGNQYARQDGSWAIVEGVTDHTQLSNIGTLSHAELETALAGKEPADATILKSADIGISVQSYNANTVIDANYVATENNYTTTEKTKLAGIASGATANSSDATLLARANHTGTQTASTISDFDAEVSNNTDVAANTSARHGAVTVTDTSTVNLTLDGVSGQNLSADIIFPITNASFTAPLTLPNNSRINGVEHFYQPGPNAPAVRGDGSALGIGDRWWKTDDGTEWFWNGTYWVSTWVNYSSGRRTSGNTAPNYTEGTEWTYHQGNKVLIRTASYSLTLPSAGDESNYYYFQIRGITATNGATTPYSSTTKMFASGRNSIVNEAINTVVDSEYFGITVIGVTSTFAVVGSPPISSNIAGSIGWSLIYE